MSNHGIPAPSLTDARNANYARATRVAMQAPARTTPVTGIRATQAAYRLYAGMTRAQSIVASAPAVTGWGVAR